MRTATTRGPPPPSRTSSQLAVGVVRRRARQPPEVVTENYKGVRGGGCGSDDPDERMREGGETGYPIVDDAMTMRGGVHDNRVRMSPPSRSRRTCCSPTGATATTTRETLADHDTANDSGGRWPRGRPRRGPTHSPYSASSTR